MERGVAALGICLNGDADATDTDGFDGVTSDSGVESFERSVIFSEPK